MKTIDMPVIELRGTPRERGRVYGESCRLLIAQTVEAWLTDLGNYGRARGLSRAGSPEVYLKTFLSDTNYFHSIKKWTPSLLEEVRGIAEGSGQPFDTLLGLQLMDEEWVYGLHQGLKKPTTKCTAFGVPNLDNGISYAGQNMDIPSWVEGKQVLLRIMATQDAPEALVFAFAGIIGLNGMNAKGLGITCNTLSQLRSSKKGLPVSFIVRAVLEKQNIDEAEAFLRSLKHASGQNFILSSQKDMRCFECSAGRVVRYEPNDLQGRVFHTNHPLVNKDNDQRLPRCEQQHIANSCARLESISDRLSDIERAIGIDDIKAALSAHDDPCHPVSRRINSENINNAIGYTAGSSIYELGLEPKLHVAAGPPCETEFGVFGFDEK